MYIFAVKKQVTNIGVFFWDLGASWCLYTKAMGI
jgi:hypothetical protein